MKTKTKHIWTDDQREAARQRMAKAREVLERARRESRARAAEVSSPVVATVEKERDPEVQAVLDGMTPERRAKLASVQGQMMARLAQTREGQEALKRFNGTAMEAEHKDLAQEISENVPEVKLGSLTEPPKLAVREIPMRTPFRLTGTQGGLMISEYGPCVCGAEKLKWHEVCLRVKVNA
jgi:hypothetical protein